MATRQDSIKTAVNVDGLLRKHGPYLERFIRSRLDPASASDVYQDVWQTAQTGLAELKHGSRSLAWLLAIARNKILALRERPKLETLSSQLSASSARGSLLGLRRPATPASIVLEGERARAVRLALSHLSEDDRELLELRYVTGLKPAEIAEVIGDASPNTIAQRVVRAARRLRDLLKEKELFASRR
jgi:RNA polymerase sigma-70 factor (ECF subfamily)